MIQNIIKTLFVLALFMPLQGCEDIAELSEPDVKLLLAVEDAAYAHDVREVLQRRFDKNRPHLFSTVESKVVEGNIEITFEGGAPSRKTVNQIIGITGEYSLVTETGQILVHSDHVLRAAVSTDYDQTALMIRLTEEGGSRVYSWTSKNDGGVLTAKFDDRVLSVAKVKGPFGRSFQTTVDLPEQELRKIARIIDTGALKTEVIILDYGR